MDIGDGKSDTITFRKGDTAEDVAREFCGKHGLPPSIVGPLATHIMENLHASQQQAQVSCRTQQPVTHACHHHMHASMAARQQLLLPQQHQQSVPCFSTLPHVRSSLQLHHAQAQAEAAFQRGHSLHSEAGILQMQASGIAMTGSIFKEHSGTVLATEDR